MKIDIINYQEMYATFLRLKNHKKEEVDFMYIGEKGRNMKKDEEGKR